MVNQRWMPSEDCAETYALSCCQPRSPVLSVAATHCVKAVGSGAFENKVHGFFVPKLAFTSESGAAQGAAVSNRRITGFIPFYTSAQNGYQTPRRVHCVTSESGAAQGAAVSNRRI